jgi:hypothetical protein
VLLAEETHGLVSSDERIPGQADFRCLAEANANQIRLQTSRIRAGASPVSISVASKIEFPTGPGLQLARFKADVAVLRLLDYRHATIHHDRCCRDE